MWTAVQCSAYHIFKNQAMWTAVTGGKGNGRELEEMETVD